jgi:hypothetical protein
VQNRIYENENLLPPFGNFEQNLEQVRAENDTIYNTDKNGEAGIYQLQISKIYTVKKLPRSNGNVPRFFAGG